MNIPAKLSPLRLFVARSLAALIFAPALFAQTAPPSSSDQTRAVGVPAPAEVAASPGLSQARAEDAILHSPFEVSAAEDRGYQALSTVGGTRLRTDLNDLAASISVITKNLMNDLAADNLDLLAPHIKGAEVGGIEGNFSDSFNGERLKGWSVGGAYRWQDRAAIGYPAVAVADATPRYDVTKPYYAPTEASRREQLSGRDA